MLGKIEEADVQDYPDFVEDVHSKLKHAFEQTHEKLFSCQERQKETHDKDSRGVALKVGDQVWLYVPTKPGKTKKLSSLWRGPYTVLDKTSPVNYRIQLIGGTTLVTVHRNRLKPCYGDPNQMIPRVSKPKHQIQPNTTSSTPSAPMSYRDALLNSPVPPAGYTSSVSTAAPDTGPPSRLVRNRQPPERYGLYIQH